MYASSTDFFYSSKISQLGKTCGFCIYCTLESAALALFHENKPLNLHKLSKNIRLIIPDATVGKSNDPFLLYQYVNSDSCF
jgi:hypothetical protein